MAVGHEVGRLAVTREFAGSARAFESLADQTITDCEIIALDDEGKAASNVLRSRRLHHDRVQYYALICWFPKAAHCLASARQPATDAEDRAGTVSAPIHYSGTFTVAPASTFPGLREDKNARNVVGKRP